MNTKEVEDGLGCSFAHVFCGSHIFQNILELF